jgi:hypothetical protein
MQGTIGLWANVQTGQIRRLIVASLRTVLDISVLTGSIYAYYKKQQRMLVMVNFLLSLNILLPPFISGDFEPNRVYTGKEIYRNSAAIILIIMQL